MSPPLPYTRSSTTPYQIPVSFQGRDQIPVSYLGRDQIPVSYLGRDQIPVSYLGRDQGEDNTPPSPTSSQKVK